MTPEKEVQMISVTSEARQLLKQKHVETIQAGGVGLRLAATPAGKVGLTPASAQAGDQMVEHDGEVVLAIARDVAQRLDGMMIDCEHTEEGTQLTIRPPGTA
ncbi:MAG TPA: hypothetical protein VFR64_07600 [Methylomirabilota bacterium]|nr:hypothetical protein [Methylomirabilota bacterium]